MLSKTSRLPYQNQRWVRIKGKKFFAPELEIFHLSTLIPGFQLATRVPKKTVALATKRHRIKRIICEAFCGFEPKLRGKFFIRVKKDISGWKMSQVKELLNCLLQDSSGLLPRS